MQALEAPLQHEAFPTPSTSCLPLATPLPPPALSFWSPTGAGSSRPSSSCPVCLCLQSYELILHEGGFKVVKRGPGNSLPYKIRYMGIFLVIETRSGMAVSWDRKTSVFIWLPQSYKVNPAGDSESVEPMLTKGSTGTQLSEPSCPLTSQWQRALQGAGVAMCPASSPSYPSPSGSSQGAAVPGQALKAPPPCCLAPRLPSPAG